MRTSLRRQIFLWYAVTLPILVAALVLGAHQILVQGLQIAMDDRLRERSEIVARFITSGPRIKVEAYAEFVDWVTGQQLPYVPVVLRISGRYGTVLAQFGDIPEQLVPDMDGLLLTASMEGQYETLNLRDHPALRLFTVPVLDPVTGDTIVVIQTGDSLASVAAAQEKLWRYSLILGIGGSVATLLAGAWLLRWGFRPLYTMLDHVRNIGNRDLGRAIPAEPRPPELQQLANTINDMLQRLGEAIKARELFIAGVSHDLRTPLTIVAGKIDLLLMQPSTDADTRQHLESMRREVRRLARMTTNLLLSAQLESNPVLSSGEIDLQELIEEVVVEAKLLADGLRLKAEATGMATVTGDYDLLKEMVLNIVDNAVKFTPAGGTITLRVDRQSGDALIQVADTGQGISEADLPHVLEPFFTSGGQRPGKRRGVGLGLAIVNQIATLHGGKVTVQSTAGAGTTVTVRLPHAAASSSLQVPGPNF
ncbi:MAG: HAMP domain-containing histidine kinase [Chloroflexi bacterium]|nr:HAMP domain-containing histidine kinase [Chloroflexota bacterium]